MNSISSAGRDSRKNSMAARNDVVPDEVVTALPFKTASSGRNPVEGACRSPLFRQLIDYAGLFPPAALATSASVANYEQYMRSEWSWILGRFILPIQKLGDFQTAFIHLPAAESGGLGQSEAKIWPLSVLITEHASADIHQIRKFNAEMKLSSSNRVAQVESIEVKVASEGEILKIAEAVPRSLDAYFEIPARDENCYAALAATGRKAKIRTGGETDDKFPPSVDVADFMQRCLAAGVAFKATAGLHHPLRSVHRYTYQPDSLSGMMHGFVNVFLAAAFMRRGLPGEVAAELLEERSANAIRFEPDGVEWRGHRLQNKDLAAARDEFAMSFGSCSFTEPVEDLLSLNLI